ncbi:hypothetical protein CaCOL14_012524 [Colletotrichum acutatum]
MSMFRAKKLDLGCFVNIRTIRDHTKRQVFMQNEPERQALRYIIQNTTLPGRVRAEAQLQLGQMHCYTRPTQIKNRCILGGKARGVFRDFKMTRVCQNRDCPSQLGLDSRRLTREYSSTSVCKRTRVTFPVSRRPVGRRICGGGRFKKKKKQGNTVVRYNERARVPFRRHATLASLLIDGWFRDWRLAACWHPKKHMYRYKYWQTMYNTSQFTCRSDLFDSGRCSFCIPRIYLPRQEVSRVQLPSHSTRDSGSVFDRWLWSSFLLTAAVSFSSYHFLVPLLLSHRIYLSLIPRLFKTDNTKCLLNHLSFYTPILPNPVLCSAATMFRRRWSGLPKDPIFSSSLEDLGYFINDQDEIRNIKEPNYYFKYYLTKNGRVNDRQRFHFNGKCPSLLTLIALPS